MTVRLANLYLWYLLHPAETALFDLAGGMKSFEQTSWYTWLCMYLKEVSLSGWLAVRSDEMKNVTFPSNPFSRNDIFFFYVLQSDFESVRSQLFSWKAPQRQVRLKELWGSLFWHDARYTISPAKRYITLHSFWQNILCSFFIESRFGFLKKEWNV